MDWQTIIAIMVGLVAVVYVMHIFLRQFNKPEVDPKCDNCPVPDLMNEKEKSD